MDLLKTPTNRSKENFSKSEQDREKVKRFMRKPLDHSERSNSKKSHDESTKSVKEFFIKTTTLLTLNREKKKEVDFFTALAESMTPKVGSGQFMRKGPDYFCNGEKTSQKLENPTNMSRIRMSHDEFAEEHEKTEKKNYLIKLKSLEAEIDLKNHEISIVSGQLQRIQGNLEDERVKRKKVQMEKRELSKEIKQLSKLNQNLKADARKHEKQREHLTKQIQFLQRINFDEKTRSMQSYRQRYLEAELERIKKQMNKSKTNKEEQLEQMIAALKQEKFTIQSHYKAMKVANQCLIKQLNDSQASFHEMVLDSEEYKKLRDKYVRFLEEYKLLRNQYWSLKSESAKGNKMNDSSLFSITISEVEEDLSLLKNEASFCMQEASYAQITPQKCQTNYEKGKRLGTKSECYYNKAN